MKQFIGFIKKEFQHIFRDKRTLIVLFGMPVVQILLFGFAITNEINNVDIAVVNNSNDLDTGKLISEINASKYFHIDDYLKNERNINTLFQKGKVKAVLVFEDKFSKKRTLENKATVQLITDASDPNVANSISNYLTAILKQFQEKENKYATVNYRIQIQSRIFYNPSLKSVYNFVPGVMTIILMLISAMMTSISITREKEQGTMEILLVSPLNPKQIIIGKVIPYIFLAAVDAIIILVLGFFVFKMPIEGTIILLTLESLLFIVASLTLGILISTISKSQQAALMISLMGLMLPTILLSGFIFPVSSMPVILQILSNIIPAKWFIIILKGILLKGVGFMYIWKESLILLLMTLFFIWISIKKYKVRLE